MQIFVGDPTKDSWTELSHTLEGYIYSTEFADGYLGTTATSFTVANLLNRNTGLPFLAKTNDLANYILVNRRTLETVNIVSNKYVSMVDNLFQNEVTVRRNVGTTSGLSWKHNDEVYLFRCIGYYDAAADHANFEINLGDSPLIRWMPVEAQNKVTLYYGDSTETPNMKRPLQIRKGKYLAEQPKEESFSVTTSTGSQTQFRFGDWVGYNPLNEFMGVSTDTVNTFAGKFVLVDGWYVDRGHMTCSFDNDGTASIPTTTLSGTTTTPIGEGLQVSLVLSQSAPSAIDVGNRVDMRVIMTALYFGKDGTAYQESDPIFQGFYQRAIAGYQSVLTPTIYADMGKLNRNIAGVRIYQDCHIFTYDKDLISAGWVDTPSNYLQVEDVLFTATTWTSSSSTNYTYSRVASELNYTISYAQAKASGANTLLANLGHAPDTNRSYMTPRYAVRQKRGQTSAIWVDQDDTMLRGTGYSGDGVHMDDGFADVTVDNSNAVLKIPLEGKGEILGMVSYRGAIWVIRAAELEIVSFDGRTELLACDCVSRGSIQLIGNSDAPSGLMWAGRSGLWIASADGGNFKIFNQNWKNLYDGTKLDTSNVSYISDDARENIIVGYEPLYNETWVQIETRLDAGGTEYVQYRYNHSSDKWNQRTIDVSGGIKYFTHRKDGTLVIGYGAGLLTYPNRDAYAAGTAYEDALTKSNPTTWTSSSNGIETSLKINIGSFYSLNQLTALIDLILDYTGTSTNSAGTFQVSFYANSSTTAFQTLTYDVSKKPKFRMAYPRGGVHRLEMKIQIPTAQEVNVKNFVLSRAELGYTQHQKFE
jgi:hypothetical protein